jgi:YD repeat-containing protein
MINNLNPFFLKKYDEAGNLIRKIEDEKIISYQYDSNGFCRNVKMYHKNSTNKLVLDSNIIFCYNKCGNVTCRFCCDKNNRILINYPAKVFFFYDSNNNLIKEVNLDSKNNLIANSQGYSILERIYDNKNRLIKIEYFNEKKCYTKNCPINADYEFGAGFEKNLQLNLNNEDFGRHNLFYSSNGIEHVKTVFDSVNCPVQILVDKYDYLGRKVEMDFCDARNNLKPDKHGVAIIRWEYDRYGNLIKESYFDENAKPKDNLYGFAYVKYYYKYIYDNDFYQPIRKEFYNNKGCLNKKNQSVYINQPVVM